MSLSGDDASNSRRQRVSRACDLCRRKKIKCDGLSPVCTNCKAFTLECSYNDTTRKRGPPKGYIEAIENRLYKLERLLEEMTAGQDDPKSKAVIQELHSPLETATGEQIRTRPVRRGRGGNKNRTFLWQSKSKKDEGKAGYANASSQPGSPASSHLMDSPILGHEESPSSPEYINDSKGQLSMDESGQVRYLGKSSGYYLLQDSRTYQNGAFHLSGCCRKTAPRDKTTPFNPLELPPNDLSTSLIHLYFEHFYPLLPLFYKKTLEPSIDQPTESVSPLLLNAIYAVASRVSTDLRVRSDPTAPDTAGILFFERAKALLDDYADVPRISTVQALLLLACHQHGTGKSARAWLYSGMAFRMAQDLGLHRNCDHWNIPPNERERRKRVFWCCFIADRLLSATFGRAFIFEERDCDVPFPSVDDDEELAAASAERPAVRLLDTFVQLIKVCDILGHVLKNIYYAKAHHHAGSGHIDHVLSALNRELSGWYNGLAPALQYKVNGIDQSSCTEPISPVIQMHMIYYTTVILLHRPFIPGPSYDASTMSLPSYNICMAAADAILDMASVLLQANHLQYVLNFTIYYVFTAGIIFIKSASSRETNNALEAKLKVNRTMRALDEIELTWFTAARSCNILGELAGLRDINLDRDGEARRKDTSAAMQVAPLPAVAGMPTPTQSTQSSHASLPASGFPMEQWASPRTPTGPSRPDYADNSRNGWKEDGSGFYEPVPSQTADPFAAPGTIVGQAQNQFDPMGAAFWGVPPSLDINQWENYLGTQQNNPTSQPYQPPPHQPLIPSNQFSSLQVRPGVPQMPIKQRLIHTDNHVDMLSGMSVMPSSPAGTVLLGYMGGQTGSDQNPNRMPQMYVPSDKSQPTDSRDHNTSGLMYW